MYSIGNQSNIQVPILDVNYDYCDDANGCNYGPVGSNESSTSIIICIIITLVILYIALITKNYYNVGQFELLGGYI